MTDILNIHREMLPNSISLIFKGAITFEMIDSIVMIISNRLDQIEENINTKKKVFGVLMECLQNLGSHVETKGEQVPTAEYDTSAVLFKIDTVEEGYKILTANFVPADKVSDLQKWIEEINSLAPDQLRKKYNEVLLNNTFSSKGGGGLGLLDIALKVGNKIDYKFQSVDKNFSFFSFETIIKKA